MRCSLDTAGCIAEGFLANLLAKANSRETNVSIVLRLRCLIISNKIPRASIEVINGQQLDTETGRAISGATYNGGESTILLISVGEDPRLCSDAGRCHTRLYRKVTDVYKYVRQGKLLYPYKADPRAKPIFWSSLSLLETSTRNLAVLCGFRVQVAI